MLTNKEKEEYIERFYTERRKNKMYAAFEKIHKNPPYLFITTGAKTDSSIDLAEWVRSIKERTKDIDSAEEMHKNSLLSDLDYHFLIIVDCEAKGGLPE